MEHGPERGRGQRGAAHIRAGRPALSSSGAEKLPAGSNWRHTFGRATLGACRGRRRGRPADPRGRGGADSLTGRTLPRLNSGASPRGGVPPLGSTRGGKVTQVAKGQSFRCRFTGWAKGGGFGALRSRGLNGPDSSWRGLWLYDFRVKPLLSASAPPRRQGVLAQTGCGNSSRWRDRLGSARVSLPCRRGAAAGPGFAPLDPTAAPDFARAELTARPPPPPPRRSHASGSSTRVACGTEPAAMESEEVALAKYAEFVKRLNVSSCGPPRVPVRPAISARVVALVLTHLGARRRGRRRLVSTRDLDRTGAPRTHTAAPPRPRRDSPRLTSPRPFRPRHARSTTKRPSNGATRRCGASTRAA